MSLAPDLKGSQQLCSAPRPCMRRGEERRGEERRGEERRGEERRGEERRGEERRGEERRGEERRGEERRGEERRGEERRGEERRGSNHSQTAMAPEPRKLSGAGAKKMKVGAELELAVLRSRK